MSKPRVLIIGGSLGGLFAANCLHRIGWDVHVYERVADDLAGRGAGIGTHDELFRVMERLGLTVDASVGVEVRSRICLDRSGKVTHEVPVQQIMSAWTRIYRPLKGALPAERYHSGMELADVRQDAGGVTATFADGTTATGDLLVAADGVRSTVRARVLPEAQPRYAGYIAWRGLLEENTARKVLPADLFERYVFCLPEGEMMLAYPVPGRDDDTRPGRRGYNFVWYHPTDEREALPRLATDANGKCHGVSIAPPLIRPEVIADIRATARALLAPQIAAVVELTPQLFFQPIFDLESPRIVIGRVVLLGDAAFVARPHVGAGITKAALDAECLADAIAAAHGDLDAALPRYAQERQRFGVRIVERARRLGEHLEAQLKPREQRTEAELHQRPEIVLREIGARLADIRELAPGV